MPPFIRRRSLTRLLWLIGLALLARAFFFSSSKSQSPEIRRHGVLEYVAGTDKHLDVQKHDFLQVRMGRDERPDLMSDIIDDGVDDFWTRFELP